MAKLVTLTLTDIDCLNIRMALNSHAMQWGEKASEARKAGDDEGAATMERTRTDYHQLWDMVNAAQEADGREPDWLARREATADALFASEA